MEEALNAMVIMSNFHTPKQGESFSSAMEKSLREWPNTDRYFCMNNKLAEWR